MKKKKKKTLRLHHIRVNQADAVEAVWKIINDIARDSKN